LAPVFAEKDLFDYMQAGAPSPHMNLSFPARPETAANLPAAVHVDGTARIQTVNPGDPGDLYSILRILKERGHEPSIINTSLNAAGEPIVQSALDALRLFLIGDMDSLFLGEWLIKERLSIPNTLREAIEANPYLNIYRRLMRRCNGVLLYNPASRALTSRAQLLLASVNWLGINIQPCILSELFDVIAATKSPVILTCAPGVDFQNMPDQMPPAVTTAPWLLISDNLYPTQVRFDQLRIAVRRNLCAFREKAAGRQPVLWMSDESRELFALELPDMAAGCIDYREVRLPLDCGAVFLVLSHEIYQTNKHALGGYRPFIDYAVWSAHDSDLHRL
jgi:hypothetical protein